MNIKIHRYLLAVSFATGLPLSTYAAAAEPTPDMPWMNRALASDQRAALAVAAMTQQEKLGLVFGYFGNDIFGHKKTEAALPLSAGYVPGVPRLGVPALFETDAGTGVASQNGPGARERTALPSNLAIAASWNRELAYAGGAMIGAEARASGFNVMLAGGVNLVRDPLNGRNFEYGGEDPLLAGVMVAQQIKGIQSNHVISTMKHFAVNDQETDRFSVDARIDLTQARMSDLLAMQLVLEKAHPGAVMCAYNKFNGVHACENGYLLNTVLKGDWGYRGFVMSDWGAVHSTVASANNGLDQQSGFEFDKSPYFSGALEEAVENGHVAQSRLDDMALRIVRSMFDKGLVDYPVAVGGAIDFAADAHVSQSIAEDGMVLLKNADHVLPLQADAKHVLVIGGHADAGVLSGGGSSQVYPVGGMAVKGLLPETWPGPVVYYPSSPLQAIRARLPKAQVAYDDGSDPKRAAQLAAQADVVLLFATQWIGEANDAKSLSLPDQQDALIDAVTRAHPHTVVVLENAGPVAMPWLEQTGAVLEAWYPGTSGGEAIARILFGEVNPSGRLPLSFPVSLGQLPRTAPAVAGLKHPFIDYNEGAAVGYKWFERQGLKPLFPFGFGLSYSAFSYSGLRVEQSDGEIHVVFKVTNTGSVAGQDVPQIYVAAPDKSWEAPRRLAGWDKLALQPGESMDVRVTLEPQMLATFKEATKTWRIAGGQYRVMLGRDASDTVSEATVQLAARTLKMH